MKKIEKAANAAPRYFLYSAIYMNLIGNSGDYLFFHTGIWCCLSRFCIKCANVVSINIDSITGYRCIAHHVAR